MSKGSGALSLIAPWMVAVLGMVFAVPSCHARAVEVTDTRPAFTYADLLAQAQHLATSPFVPPDETVPEFLRSLTLEQWNQIHYVGENGAGTDAGQGPFALRLLHPGSIFTQTVKINLVDGDGVHALAFSPDLFTVADEKLAAQLQQTQLGFAGFTLLRPTGNGQNGDDLLGLMGTSHLQFKGRKANFGGNARPVALDTAMPTGEQRPFFREYWLHQPEDQATNFVVHALMDSPGMTGAVEMIVTPGTTVVVDVRTTFYRREGGSQPVKIGLAPVAGMFMASETERGDPSDFRPEVHNCDGLLLASDDGWRWVPLKNPQRLAINAFELDTPRGFGLIQRDTNFDHYQDLVNRFERCSSVWVEPKGVWGPGRVELVEIPTNRDYHQNILAYWIPAEGSPLVGGGTAKNGGPAPAIALEYRLFWTPPNPPVHQLGAVAATRIARDSGAASIRFVVDFEGGALADLPADTGLTSVVEAPEEAPLLEKQLTKNEVTGGWRLVLRFRLPENGVLDRLLTARDGPAPLRFTAHLTKGENLPDALTEKWTYNLTP